MELASKDKPRLFNDETDLRVSHDDMGHEVALFVYNKEELKKMITKSRELLSEISLDIGKTFRCGAWLKSDDLFDALSEEGFEMDCSAVDGNFLMERWGDFQLSKWTKELWPDCSRTSQPYIMEFDGYSMLEVPNNGCLSDYVDEDHMLETVRVNHEYGVQNKLEQVYVSIGFHQETAVKFLERLDKAVELIKNYCVTNNLELNFISKVEKYESKDECGTAISKWCSNGGCRCS